MTEETQSTPTATTERAPRSNPYLIPGAIVIAGLVIAGAIVAKGGTQAEVGGGKEIAAEVLPVTDEDHIYGPEKPDVYLIEYSDYQCPYCERFHGTVKSLVSEFDGKLSWVYRHFPLDSIHPEARPAALASECVAELGGSDAFWKFTDKIFENQRELSTELYVSIVRELGLQEQAFTECFTSAKYDDRIERDLQNGQELGGQGTPYNVLLTRKGEIIKFSGALPDHQVRVLVNRALKSLDK